MSRPKDKDVDRKKNEGENDNENESSEETFQEQDRYVQTPTNRSSLKRTSGESNNSRSSVVLKFDEPDDIEDYATSASLPNQPLVLENENKPPSRDGSDSGVRRGSSINAFPLNTQNKETNKICSKGECKPGTSDDNPDCGSDKPCNPCKCSSGSVKQSEKSTQTFKTISKPNPSENDDGSSRNFLPKYDSVYHGPSGPYPDEPPQEFGKEFEYVPLVKQDGKPSSRPVQGIDRGGYFCEPDDTKGENQGGQSFFGKSSGETERAPSSVEALDGQGSSHAKTPNAPYSTGPYETESGYGYGGPQAMGPGGQNYPTTFDPYYGPSAEYGGSNWPGGVDGSGEAGPPGVSYGGAGGPAGPYGGAGGPYAGPGGPYSDPGGAYGGPYGGPYGDPYGGFSGYGNGGPNDPWYGHSEPNDPFASPSATAGIFASPGQKKPHNPTHFEDDDYFSVDDSEDELQGLPYQQSQKPYPQQVGQNFVNPKPQGYPQDQGQGYPLQQNQGFPQQEDQGYPQQQDLGYPQTQSQGPPPQQQITSPSQDQQLSPAAQLQQQPMSSPSQEQQMPSQPQQMPSQPQQQKDLGSNANQNVISMRILPPNAPGGPLVLEASAAKLNNQQSNEIYSILKLLADLIKRLTNSPTQPEIIVKEHDQETLGMTEDPSLIAKLKRLSPSNTEGELQYAIDSSPQGASTTPSSPVGICKGVCKDGLPEGAVCHDTCKGPCQTANRPSENLEKKCCLSPKMIQRITCRINEALANLNARVNPSCRGKTLPDDPLQNQNRCYAGASDDDTSPSKPPSCKPDCKASCALKSENAMPRSSNQSNLEGDEDENALAKPADDENAAAGDGEGEGEGEGANVNESEAKENEEPPAPQEDDNTAETPPRSSQQRDSQKQSVIEQNDGEDPSPDEQPDAINAPAGEGDEDNEKEAIAESSESQSCAPDCTGPCASIDSSDSVLELMPASESMAKPKICLPDCSGPCAEETGAAITDVLCNDTGLSECAKCRYLGQVLANLLANQVNLLANSTNFLNNASTSSENKQKGKNRSVCGCMDESNSKNKRKSQSLSIIPKEYNCESSSTKSKNKRKSQSESESFGAFCEESSSIKSKSKRGSRSASPAAHDITTCVCNETDSTSTKSRRKRKSRSDDVAQDDCICDSSENPSTAVTASTSESRRKRKSRSDMAPAGDVCFCDSSENQSTTITASTEESSCNPKSSRNDDCLCSSSEPSAKAVSCTSSSLSCQSLSTSSKTKSLKKKKKKNTSEECDCCHCRALRQCNQLATVSANQSGGDNLANDNKHLRAFIDSLLFDLEAMNSARQSQDQPRTIHKGAKIQSIMPSDNSYPVTLLDVKELGVSSLYLKWVIHDCFNIAGYEIYVDGLLTNRYFNAKHETAVVCDVCPSEPHEICLVAQPKTSDECQEPKWIASVYKYDPRSSSQQCC